MYCLRFVNLVLLSVLMTEMIPLFCGHDAEEEREGLRQFFEKMDDNHDGQVDELEAKRYIGESIGGSEFDSGEELTEAFHTMVHNMNQDDEEFHTISQDEVKQHLHSLEQVFVVVSVKEWVEHGLGLPQYAQAFKENMITADDFPLLVNDDGVTLRDELKISSRLHRNQIIRGLKRLILGLGDLPSSPRNLSCVEIAKENCVLHWDAPLELGNPPVHKYVIESGPVWKTVAEMEAKLDRVHYTHTVESICLFRLAAWTSYGSSKTITFPKCTQDQLGSMDSFVDRDEVKSRKLSPGIWSMVVIGVMLGLRILTRRRLQFLKCCFLRKSTELFMILKWNFMVKKLEHIVRVECETCQRQQQRKPPAISKRVARSHKIPPTQHFEIDNSHLRASSSSPSLDQKPRVDAVGKVENYNLRSWAEKAYPSSKNLDLTEEVPDGLIEGQCAHKGCVREWNGAFKLRNRWSRHFCSLCLRTYCYEHTQISPHGSFGFCGQHSRCVCITCFQKQTPERQALLEKTNKLDKSLNKRADLEKGCCIKETTSSVRSFFLMRRNTSKASTRSSSEEEGPISKRKKFISRDSQTDLTLMETADSNKKSK